MSKAHPISDPLNASMSPIPPVWVWKPSQLKRYPAQKQSSAGSGTCCLGSIEAWHQPGCRRSVCKCKSSGATYNLILSPHSIGLCLQRLHPVLVRSFESWWGPVVLHADRRLVADDWTVEIPACWHRCGECGVLWHHPNLTHTLHRPQGCICKVHHSLTSLATTHSHNKTTLSAQWLM